MIIRWLLYFIPAILIELYCYLTAPIVALFVVRSWQRDTVKRLNRHDVLLPRDNLVKWLSWHQTHDNNCDEYFYGMFNTDSHFKWLRTATQDDYDNSAWLRYVCRVHWLWRNCAYGFHYHLFSTPLEINTNVYSRGIEGAGFWYQLAIYPSSFQLEAHIPLGKRYFSVNMGWKSHKKIPRKMYANRIPPFGIRQYK